MKILLGLFLTSSLVCASDGTKKKIIVVNKTKHEVQLVHPQDEELCIILKHGDRYEVQMDPVSLKKLSCYYMSSENQSPMLLCAENIQLDDDTEISITNEKDVERIFLAVSLAKAKKSKNRKSDLRRSLTRSVSIEIIKYVLEQVE